MNALGLALSVMIGVALGFFGGGGSILTVPLLVYVFGLEPKQAIASSLLVVGLASLSGAWQHWRAGNVDVRTGTIFGSAGLAGAYLGARLTAYIDGTLLLLLFAAMMLLTSLAMWRGRRATSAGVPGKRASAKLLAQGFGVGLLTGLVGAGGGFLIVPALALWAGLALPVAIGTSLVIIVLNTLVGFAGHAATASVDLALVAAVASAAIAGSFFGTRLSRRLEPAKLRRSFAAFVLVVAVFVFVRETDVWLETARTAVPTSVPQLAFVLIVLAVGIAMGRVSRRGASDPLADRLYSEGGGI
jgi:uncharacterized protein